MTDEAERLYGLPLEEFTAAREAVVRELRADGRAEEAKEVSSLRKPVLAAWVVNRLARDEREEMRKLTGAAEEIKQGKAGADGRFRASLDRLTAAGRELLESTGHASDSAVQQVAATLRAGAAGSPDALSAGTLTKPLEASGFGAMAGAKMPPATRTDESRKPRKRVDSARLEKARHAAEEAREEARALERAAREAERAARAAQARAEAARKKVAAAERRVAEARGR